MQTTERRPFNSMRLSDMKPMSYSPRSKADKWQAASCIEASMSPRMPDAVCTVTDPAARISRDVAAYVAREWQTVIAKLNNWAQNPAQLEDEGLDAPGPDIIQRAIEFATDYMEKGYAAPTSIAPDPNGGIVFELKCEGDSSVFHFWDDGSESFFVSEASVWSTGNPFCRQSGIPRNRRGRWQRSHHR